MLEGQGLSTFTTIEFCFMSFWHKMGGKVSWSLFHKKKRLKSGILSNIAKSDCRLETNSALKCAIPIPLFTKDAGIVSENCDIWKILAHYKSGDNAVNVERFWPRNFYLVLSPGGRIYHETIGPMPKIGKTKSWRNMFLAIYQLLRQI